MPNPSRIAVALVVGVAALALVAAGCGGEGDAAADEPADVAPIEAETETATDSEVPPETETSSASSGGTAPAPGKGVLSLDDGRTYSITVGECEFQPSGTIEISGTSDEGSTFDLTQFQLGDEWRQTDASIKFDNGDQIYVIVSSASPDGEAAEVEGKTIVWEQAFQELDESSNSIVYSGSGTLRLTCP